MHDVSNAELGRKLDTLLIELRKLDHHITGGADPKLGLNFRVAWLEREAARARGIEKRILTVIWTAVSGVALAAIGWLWTKITGTKLP